MMKKISGLLVLVLLAMGLPMLASNGQKAEKPSDKYVTKSYNFKEIKGIKASSGVKVFYTQSTTTQPVIVKGPENVVAKLEVKIGKDKTLEVSMRESSFYYVSDKQIPQVYVSVPNVSRLQFSSGASLIISGSYSTQSDVTIDMSSGADAEIAEMTCANLAITSASGAGVDIKNLIARKLDLTASSGAEVDFKNLTTQKLALNASSGSDVDVKKLDANQVDITAASGSDVDVCGVAVVANYTASSGGDIKAGKLVATSGEANAGVAGSIRCNIKHATIHESAGGEVKNAQ